MPFYQKVIDFTRILLVVAAILVTGCATKPSGEWGRVINSWDQAQWTMPNQNMRRKHGEFTWFD